MIVEIINNDKIISTTEYSKTNEGLINLYVYISSISKINVVDYKRIDENITIVMDDNIIKFKNISDKNLIKLLDEIATKNLIKSNFNKLNISTNNNQFLVSNLNSNNVGVVLETTNEELTEKSKKIYFEIINREFSKWQQSFWTCPIENGNKIVYDENILILSDKLFNLIKPQIKQMEEEYLKLYDNPFKRRK